MSQSITQFARTHLRSSGSTRRPIPPVLVRFAADQFLHQISFGAVSPPSAGDLLAGRVDALFPRDGVIDLDHDPLRPQLVYLHLLHTHFPWNRFDGSENSPFASFEDLDDPADAALTAENAYQSVLWADRLLGPLIDTLLAIPPEERIVILLSDHGTSWRSAPYHRFQGVLQSPQIDVPLVLLAPGLPAGTDTDLFPLIDLYPTLIQLLNDAAGTAILAPPDKIDGLDLRTRTTARDTRIHIAFSAGCRFRLAGDQWLFEELYEGFQQPPCGEEPRPAEELSTEARAISGSTQDR